MSDRVSILADIIGSRALDDRAEAQGEIEGVFRRIHDYRPFAERPRATVGDEFQAVAPDLAHALWATTVARLLLDGEVGCRFGLGRGEFGSVRTESSGEIPEGPAWWNARAAIEKAHALEEGRSTGFVRSWYVGEGEAGVNSYLLLRDDAIARMSPEARRITAARLFGRTQSEIAVEMDVSQSAVSQNLAGSGGRALFLADQQVSG